ncbi:hypothetical protein FKM82_015410 [Ascaphus truei]
MVSTCVSEHQTGAVLSATACLLLLDNSLGIIRILFEMTVHVTRSQPPDLLLSVTALCHSVCHLTCSSLFPLVPTVCHSVCPVSCSPPVKLVVCPPVCSVSLSLCPRSPV